MSIVPLKVSPTAKAAAPRDDGRLLGCELAALVEQPHDRLREDSGGDRARGQEQEADLSEAERGGAAEAVGVVPRGEPREGGKRTVATATENIPCGSM